MDKLSYLYVFLQSNLIEFGVYFLFYRRFMSWKKSLALVTFSNSLTHPIVFFGFMASGMSYLYSILFAELFAIGGEALLHGYFGSLSYRRSCVASFVSNIVSWQLGPVLTYFLFF